MDDVLRPKNGPLELYYTMWDGVSLARYTGPTPEDILALIEERGVAHFTRNEVEAGAAMIDLAADVKTRLREAS